MFGIYAPISDPAAWQKLLADPEKHWRQGYSARALAHCWLAAGGKFPPEVSRVFIDSKIDALIGIEPLLALIEHKVGMSGKGYPSHNDLFVLAKASGQLVCLAIEGKVDEEFDATVEKWNDKTSKQKRLNYILNMIGLSGISCDHVRYQLLHRMASAVIESVRFGSSHAVMLIHSFSPTNKWFGDYQAFLDLYGKQGQMDELVFLRNVNGINLYAGWVCGDKEFLKA